MSLTDIEFDLEDYKVVEYYMCELECLHSTYGTNTTRGLSIFFDNYSILGLGDNDIIYDGDSNTYNLNEYCKKVLICLRIIYCECEDSGNAHTDLEQYIEEELLELGVFKEWEEFYEFKKEVVFKLRSNFDDYILFAEYLCSPTKAISQLQFYILNDTSVFDYQSLDTIGNNYDEYLSGIGENYSDNKILGIADYLHRI